MSNKAYILETVKTKDGDFEVSQEELLFPMQTQVVHQVGLRIGGYVVKWNSVNKDGLLFLRATNFRTEYHNKYPILFEHGQNSGIGNDPLGFVDVIEMNDIGMRIEGTLNWNSKWWLPVMIKFKQGKLIWSAGPTAHLIRKHDNMLLEYPIAEFSLEIMEETDVENTNDDLPD